MPSPALTQQLERNAVAADDLAAQVQDAGVEHVYYQFTTLNGRVMAKVVPARHLRRNLERGVQFHGSAIADLATSRHGTLIASGPEAEEFVALPDAATFAVLPWDPTFARVICNLYTRPDRRERGRRAAAHLRPLDPRAGARGVPRAHRPGAALGHGAGDELARARSSRSGPSPTCRRRTTWAPWRRCGRSSSA